MHVWRISLDPDPATLETLGSLLSDDERSRADRFRFDHHRRRFVVGRARVRQLLSRYTGIRPKDLVFAYGRYGKPRLPVAALGQDIRFNFSNSQDLALLAVTRGVEVGVDLEQIKPMERYLRLADRFFTVRESATLRQLPEPLRISAFFHCWTMKEAFLKSTGEGLHFDLNRVEVSTDPREPAQLHAVDGDQTAASRWFIQTLEPGDGYAGALVVEGPVSRVETWSFE